MSNSYIESHRTLGLKKNTIQLRKKDAILLPLSLYCGYNVAGKSMLYNALHSKMIIFELFSLPAY